jgi:hypothetical protein
MVREEQEIRYPDYPLFKGLQKPLEFMGIQGRYIYWAAATAYILTLKPSISVFVIPRLKAVSLQWYSVIGG